MMARISLSHWNTSGNEIMEGDCIFILYSPIIKYWRSHHPLVWVHRSLRWAAAGRLRSRAGRKPVACSARKKKARSRLFLRRAFGCINADSLQLQFHRAALFKFYKIIMLLLQYITRVIIFYQRFGTAKSSAILHKLTNRNRVLAIFCSNFTEFSRIFAIF